MQQELFCLSHLRYTDYSLRCPLQFKHVTSYSWVLTSLHKSSSLPLESPYGVNFPMRLSCQRSLARSRFLLLVFFVLGEVFFLMRTRRLRFRLRGTTPCCPYRLPPFPSVCWRRDFYLAFILPYCRLDSPVLRPLPHDLPKLQDVASAPLSLFLFSRPFPLARTPIFLSLRGILV